MKNKLIMLISWIILFSVFLMNRCTLQNTQDKSAIVEETLLKPSLTTSEFGYMDGQEVQLLKISFPGKLEAAVTNYGGIVTKLRIPDKEGLLEDVVLGYDNLQGYLSKTPYFGALIGRYGNRISKGKFQLNGEQYQLVTNNGTNHLHGGLQGFDKVVWEIADTLTSDDTIVIRLKHVSEDGEEGYPGTLTTYVTYTFKKDEWRIAYEATTDKTTIVNLTQHSYFNLSGDIKESILGHKLLINANYFLPVDSTLIPTGESRPVVSTPFDFGVQKKIGLEIDGNDAQLRYGLGYDHCWILDKGIRVDEVAASLYHPESGRFLEVFTKEPALQFYSGNFLDGTIKGKNNKVYEHRYGLCLETQHYPDSPNKPNFPSVVLEPGEKYETETTYKFSAK